VSEFDLIDEILATLGDSTQSDQVRVGPGDDGAVVAVPDNVELVASIDALVGDVHFPLRAQPQLIGYRALMVSTSDLAAMGAAPGYALVALSLPEPDADWARGLAQGLRAAAKDCGMTVVGGNIATGPVNISVSVHGWVPIGSALTRSGAKSGDGIYVTGALGGAAAALARGDLDRCREDDLDALESRYFKPQARLTAGQRLRGYASAAIDVSDGLLKDLGHICAASNVGAKLLLDAIPVTQGASVDNALAGGDDYELCFTSASTPPDLGCQTSCIGSVVDTLGMWIDGQAVELKGYEHFVS